MNKIRNRWIDSLIQKALKSMPVVTITGARQTGKTTLVRNSEYCKNRKYYSFDQLDILEQAKRSPDSLLKELPVTIDEVQRVPEFLLAVKKRVDENRENGGIILTGSANLSLMNNVSESLAGRSIYIEIPPFCWNEWQQSDTALKLIHSFFDKEIYFVSNYQGQAWENCLLKGGYPTVLSYDDEESYGIWFSGYIQTYLERDLRMLSNIASLVDFQKVMRLAALRTGRLLNQSEVSRDAAVAQPTCHRYLNLLETGYQISRLNNFHVNQTTSIIKNKKLLWSDAGLSAFLAGIENIHSLAARPDIGFWLEQTIFQTLQAWKSTALNQNILYWRGEGQEEVDFVLMKNNKVVPVEIKKHTQLSSHDLVGIKSFQQKFGKTFGSIRGIVFYGGNDIRYIDNEIYAIPFGLLH